MISQELLRTIPLLNQLDSRELAELGSRLRERLAPKGTYIVYVDDPGSSLMFVTDGVVKITLDSGDGKEVILAQLGAGDFFGEIALLTGEERSANVIAATDCRLLVLAEEDFQKHVLDNSGLAVAMLKALAFRLKAASAKIGDLALYDVHRRVCRTLKSLGSPQEREGNTVFVIDERPTHQELASMVGTSREMVTRALKGLEEDGDIVVDQKRITVLKLPR